MKNWSGWILGCAAVCQMPCAHAERFENAYLSFELPHGWACHQEGTEFVCRARRGQAQKEALFIMTAKFAGPTDTLASYSSHLNKQPAKGKIVRPAEQSVINGVVWVDALQLGSEVQDYYTRYAGTVKNDLGILITFSAHKHFYEKYTGAFTLALHTIVVKPLNSAKKQ